MAKQFKHQGMTFTVSERTKLHDLYYSPRAIARQLAEYMLSRDGMLKPGEDIDIYNFSDALYSLMIEFVRLATVTEVVDSEWPVCEMTAYSAKLLAYFEAWKAAIEVTPALLFQWREAYEEVNKEAPEKN